MQKKTKKNYQEMSFYYFRHYLPTIRQLLLAVYLGGACLLLLLEAETLLTVKLATWRPGWKTGVALTQFIWLFLLYAWSGLRNFLFRYRQIIRRLKKPALGPPAFVLLIFGVLALWLLFYRYEFIVRSYSNLLALLPPGLEWPVRLNLYGILLWFFTAWSFVYPGPYVDKWLSRFSFFTPLRHWLHDRRRPIMKTLLVFLILLPVLRMMIWRLPQHFLFLRIGHPQQLPPEFWIFEINLYALFLLGFAYACETYLFQKPVARSDLPDGPIRNHDEDQLNRNIFAERLYRIILRLPFENSMVFGLYGKWGEGKSSIIELFKRKFEQAHLDLEKTKTEAARQDALKAQKFIVIQFDPWIYRDEAAILKAFYEEVEKKLGGPFIYFSLKRTLRKYNKYLGLGLSGNPLAWLDGLKFNLHLTEESMNGVKDELVQLIRKTGRTFLIIIDDLDRLERPELMLVLKLIRLHTDLPWTRFLLTFDPEIVARQVGRGISSNKDEALAYGLEFIEKIVQHPIDLPLTESELVIRYILRRLGELLRELKFDPQIFEPMLVSIQKLFTQGMGKIIATLRNGKRLINGLRGSLPPVAWEVDLCDFFLLEIIRIFYPGVYNDIRENFVLYLSELYVYNPETEEEARRNIQNIVSNRAHREALQLMLEYLFPLTGLKKPLKECHIADPDKFEIYFTGLLPRRERSNRFMRQNIAGRWNRLTGDERRRAMRSDFEEFHKSGHMHSFLESLEVYHDEFLSETLADLLRIIAAFSEHFDSSSSMVVAGRLCRMSLPFQYPKETAILFAIIARARNPYLPVYVLALIHEGSSGASEICGRLMDEMLYHLDTVFIHTRRDLLAVIADDRELGFVLLCWITRWETVHDFGAPEYRKRGSEIADYLYEQVREKRGDFLRLGRVLFALKDLYVSPEARAGILFFQTGGYGELIEKFGKQRDFSLEERRDLGVFDLGK